ncbi:restriction endonuclease subunit S [Campylobacter devanensis]|uniref:restriction endonuclease subunit S n=1 Tax=Campylobacter devanensis TaxID=3161138 RepID=UPI000A346D0E|nr:restriction endonuclease subunit S [Campylobacter sp. P0098]
MKSPKIRFKEFQNEWNSRILGDICEIYDGTHQTPKYTKTGVMFLSVENIKDLKSKKFISIDDFTKNYKVYPEFGDVLLTRIGDIGTPNIYLRNEKVAFYVTLALLKPKSVKSFFLKNLFYSSFTKKEIDKKTLHIAFPKKINKNEIEKIQIRIPSDIKEQEKIGEFFRKIDGILDLENSRFKKLENFKKTMLDKLFVKDGADEPQIRLGSFKGEWNSRILGDIGETYCGLSGKNKDDFGHGNAKFVPYINIFQNSIVNLAKLEKIEIDKRQNSVKNGDIFFTTSSETPQEVAMSSVYLGNEENIYLNSFCFGFRPKEFLNSYFLAYFFRSHYFRDKVIPLAQGISRYNISKNKMMELKIRIPNDIKEQEAIGEFFRKIDGILEFSQKKITKLENIKKYLLNKMFM